MQQGDTLTVNGKPHPFRQGMTVSSLLAELMDGPATVVVELNGTIVPRGEFGEATLASGDRIEIVHFVGGG